MFLFHWKLSGRKKQVKVKVPAGIHDFFYFLIKVKREEGVLEICVF